MSLHDRNYARGSSGSGWSGSGGGDGLRRLAEWLNWSFSIGWYFGIRVRVHLFFIIFAALEVLPHRAVSALGVGAVEQMLSSLRWIAILFGSVLLHEFGHCFGCRWVGGRANDILMWPLGGLAFCDPPRRPWPEFVTVICGPLVNVALAGIGYLGLLAWVGLESLPVSLNPFDMRPEAAYWRHFDSVGVRLVADIFVANYVLLLFNVLMPFLPFDGGRLVQIALWKMIGHARSMHIATTLGMIGAAAIAVVGVAKGQSLLVIMALFGFLTCLQQRQQLRMIAAAEPEVDPRFAAAYENQSGQSGGWFASGAGEGGDDSTDAESARPGPVARWRESRERKRVAAVQRAREDDEAEINRILDKVHAGGLQSLTAQEKQTLQQATDRQRRR